MYNVHKSTYSSLWPSASMNMTNYKSKLFLGCRLLSGLWLNSQGLYAQTLSFQDAEKQLLQSSYSSQAYQSLEQASKLEAEAVTGLGVPRIDLNVRAYAFHNELDIRLRALKNTLDE